MNDLTVIVPVKDDARRLANCLASLARNEQPHALIVADNGSSDDSPAVAVRMGARVLALPGLRVSELRNAGASAATSSLLAFVDADHELGPSWIAAAKTGFDSASVGAVGALYEAPESGTWVQRMYGILRGRTQGRQEVAWLGSGNLVVRRTAFEQVGGFDESLEACEDVDLCRRLRKVGWQIIGDERLKSVHVGDPASLGALFRAERWRGRDNIRVSLRGPLQLRDLPSLLTPPLILLALISLVIAIPAAAATNLSWRLPAAAAAVILGLAALKTIRLCIRAGNASLRFVVQAMAVTLTYDLARSMALITRAPHHRRPASGMPIHHHSSS